MFAWQVNLEPMLSLSRRPLQAGLVLVFMLAIGTVIGVATRAQAGPEDLTALARETFTEISAIYQSGGEPRELVDRLNNALRLLEQARLERQKGDETNALRLEESAREMILKIKEDIPAASEKAQHESTMTILKVLASIPVSVGLSTFAFYTGLKIWRWYEKAKLFEMRIVEKKKD